MATILKNVKSNTTYFLFITFSKFFYKILFKNSDTEESVKIFLLKE